MAPGYPGCPGKEAIKRVSLSVCQRVSLRAYVSAGCSCKPGGAAIATAEETEPRWKTLIEWTVDGCCQVKSEMDKLFEELDEGDKVSEAEPSSVSWHWCYIVDSCGSKSAFDCHICLFVEWNWHGVFDFSFGSVAVNAIWTLVRQHTL